MWVWNPCLVTETAQQGLRKASPNSDSQEQTVQPKRMGTLDAGNCGQSWRSCHCGQAVLACEPHDVARQRVLWNETWWWFSPAWKATHRWHLPGSPCVPMMLTCSHVLCAESYVCTVAAVSRLSCITEVEMSGWQWGCLESAVVSHWFSFCARKCALMYLTFL